MYEYQEFPKFKYHRTEEPRIVNSKEEEDELGDEWKNAPVEAVEEVRPTRRNRKA